ncbi:MAG: exosortase VPDSG-CTERM-specific [Verrucomicrobia bacterium]|nr:exosortase VPDSG-CTERM-specific [Verrucomicrobiota bacterium]
MHARSPSGAVPPANFPRGLIVLVAVLVAAFAVPLYRLLRFSIGHELYSHIVLIPVISAYLVWQLRATLPPPTAPRRGLAAALFAAGFAILLSTLVIVRTVPRLAAEDILAVTTLAFLCMLAGALAWHLGRATFRLLLFPLCFLAFMIPLPVAALDWVEGMLQIGSAIAARAYFALAGTTVFSRGLIFQLPGITLQVAPECSGIHSSLALLITSILAGYFFLRSPARRWILALAVIPLALLRNGFRVFVIGELCVRFGPHMIDSYIHRHGGPIFFVLSLIPFFFLLFWLVRQEGSSRPAPPPTASSG